MAEKVDDEPVCSICLDSYKRPKILPCFHTFCQACLEQLGDEETHDETRTASASGGWMSRSGWFSRTVSSMNRSSEVNLLTKRTQTLVCPICRENHQLSKIGVSALPNNFSIEQPNLAISGELGGEKCGNGIDSNTAVAFCYDCECCLCKQCLTSHVKMIATRRHTTVSLEYRQILEKRCNTFKVPRKVPSCSKHGIELKLYCHDCNDAICCECAINDPHQLHKYEYLDKTASEICDRLPELLKKMSKRQENLKDKVKLLEVDWRYYSAVNGAAAINKAFDGIVEIVETRRRKVLAEWKQRSSAIEERVKSTKNKLVKVSRASNFIKELDTTNKSDFELVTMLKPMMGSFEELVSAYSSLQSLSMFDDHSQYVVTEGGDMNQLAAQLPKIVYLSPNINVCTPGTRFYGSNGKDIEITIHRMSNAIPLEAVTVNLSSGSTVVPTNTWFPRGGVMECWR